MEEQVLSAGTAASGPKPALLFRFSLTLSPQSPEPGAVDIYPSQIIEK